MTRVLCSIVSACAACWFVASCAEAPPPRTGARYAPAPLSETSPATPTTMTIQIISEPPGARIEVNDDYIGNAPCSAQVRCDAEGRFWDSTHIRAIPREDGYTQMKFFSGYQSPRGQILRSDAVPSRIFFDMRLQPVPQDININVNEHE